MCQRPQSTAEIETQIDALLQGTTALGELLQSAEGVLIARHGLPVSPAPPGRVPRPFALFSPAVPCQRLEGRNNVRMQRPPPLLEEPPVGDLVRQGVLEGVHALRKEAGVMTEV